MIRAHGMRAGFLTALICAVVASPALAGERNQGIAGIAYSPSNLLAVDDLERDIPAATIEDDLVALSKITKRIRVYSIGHQADRVLPMAKALGMRVSVGIALGPELESNDREITHAIDEALAHPGVVDRIFVGNEVRLRNDLPADVLIGYILRVKAAVARAGIAVGTGEVWGIWMEEKKLAAACDFIGVHLFPYWDGVPLDTSVDYVRYRYDELKAAFPRKPIVIAEVGWPSAGERRMGAMPSVAGEMAFIKSFVLAAKAAHYDYYLFEAYDQPWKAAREAGGVGPHWGLMDVERRPKVGLPQ